MVEALQPLDKTLKKAFTFSAPTGQDSPFNLGLEGLFSTPQLVVPDGPFTQELKDLSLTAEVPAIEAIRHMVRLTAAIDNLPPDEIIKNDFLCHWLTRKALWDIVSTPGGANPGVLCTYRGYLLYILDSVQTRPELEGTTLHIEVEHQARACGRIIDLMQQKGKHPVVDQESKAQYDKSMRTILAVVNKIGNIKNSYGVFKKFPTPCEAQESLKKWDVSISDLAEAFDTIEAIVPFLCLSAREIFIMLNGYISIIDDFARIIKYERPEESLQARRSRYEKMIEILTKEVSHDKE